METINFEDFKKIDIRIGKILTAEKVEGSDKLLKLEVDFGPVDIEPSDNPDSKKNLPTEEGGKNNGGWTPAETVPAEKRTKRQIIAGIGKAYEPENLIGKKCPFVFNLEPKMLKGLESQGMILCPSDDGQPVLLHPDKEISPGSIVK